MKKEVLSSKITDVETSQNALLSLDLNNNVQLWSNGCESLFGYSKKEVEAQKSLVFLKEKDQAIMQELWKRILADEAFVHYMDAITKQGNAIRIKMHLSPLKEGNKITGSQIVIDEVYPKSAALKRTFSIIRNMILFELYKGEKTINQVAINTNINWKTVEKHLVHLVGKKQAQEIFTSKFVRIFGISELGKKQVDDLRSRIPKEETDESSLAAVSDIEVRQP